MAQSTDTFNAYTYIYALCDPVTGDIRYVGKADNPHKRFKQHIALREAKPTYKTKWVKSLLQSGRQPLLRILEQVAIEDWQDCERQWIEICKTQGCRLTNIGDGGIGGKTLSAETLSPEERKRRSDTARARMQTMWDEIKAERKADWDEMIRTARERGYFDE
jgi:hypothetical protein